MVFWITGCGLLAPALLWDLDNDDTRCVLQWRHRKRAPVNRDFHWESGCILRPYYSDTRSLLNELAIGDYAGVLYEIALGVYGDHIDSLGLG